MLLIFFLKALKADDKKIWELIGSDRFNPHDDSLSRAIGKERFNHEKEGESGLEGFDKITKEERIEWDRISQKNIGSRME